MQASIYWSERTPMTYVLVGENTYEEEIKKSRFIAIARPADTVAQAMAFIEERSVPDARHNCWAYKIGDNYRFSDDGEPGGTAGRPILQAIEGQECDFVAVLVIRRPEEHTSELQSRGHLVCRLLLEKKNTVYSDKYEGKRSV